MINYSLDVRARAAHALRTCVVYNNKYIIYCRVALFSRTMEWYNAAVNAWYSGPELTHEHTEGAACVLGSRVIVAGGTTYNPFRDGNECHHEMICE